MKLLNMLIEEFDSIFWDTKTSPCCTPTSTCRIIYRRHCKVGWIFPDNTDIDPHALHAEFSNFVADIDLLNNTFENMEQIAEFSEERKYISHLTNCCYLLLLTILFTVAKDERTFSRLKIVKTAPQTTMGDKRLESLVFLSCEKDINDSIDINVIAKDWAYIKMKRIKFIQLRLKLYINISLIDYNLIHSFY